MVARAQTASSTPAATPAAATGPAAAPPAVTADAPVYPANITTIEATTKAGILGIRAGDIPRYTQTGPIPNPAPARLGVLPPFPHDAKLPTIWTIGDSTVRTGINGTGDDKVGQWGWGTPLVAYFDPKKVNVVNRAVGGTTAMSFYNGQWKAMVNLLKPGDVVILQFGTNSGRGEVESVSGTDSFGSFIQAYITDTRAKGATPVVCSLIPRNGRDSSGKINRNANTQAGWARQVAAAEGAGFIDLNELVARKYDALDKAAVDDLFSGSPHTSWTGAVVNAETVISGLKALKNDPVAAYYVPQVKEIAPAPDLSTPAGDAAKTEGAAAASSASPASSTAPAATPTAPAK